jgi:hypothetical protein
MVAKAHVSNRPAFETYVCQEFGNQLFRSGGWTMRFIFGVFVGAALMLGSAYLHDVGVVRAGPTQAFVNWDT